MDELKGGTAWLSIVGIGEDGMAGLSAASRAALVQAEVVTGAPRHLALLAAEAAPQAECLTWPTPFADGIERLLALRGRRVVMLASGDPFWFGAGSVVARHLAADEWIALPAPSTFSLAAARLGWALEQVRCIGLHAAPFERLRPLLAPETRLLVLVRDGAAVGELAAWLVAQGFGDSVLHVLEALGGACERGRRVVAAEYALDDVQHPVAVGIEAHARIEDALPCVAGLADDWFEHDGQITKRPMRALTLSALAPRPGERLWDVGAGSGSIGIEWLLAHPANEAIGFEADPQRAERARTNARALGVDRLKIVTGRAPQVFDGQPLPDVVFIGGGLSEALLLELWARLAPGTRVVANAVTLESEALLARWHAAHGGSLLRVELAEAAPLGGRRGWKSAYPVVQWSVSR
ncbi:precorrin-6y C5,15-methyltransferase (decarboxylating) subunit CbiE [Thauera sp.]|uniref:precorrin-6y C5,15-methyltransferase (decarboxylating) subunit CbiE n=1 Tax=Thauera sp. TaxID=1905334 RepID=UPI0039E724CF